MVIAMAVSTVMLSGCFASGKLSGEERAQLLLANGRLNSSALKVEGDPLGDSAQVMRDLAEKTMLVYNAMNPSSAKTAGVTVRYE